MHTGGRMSCRAWFTAPSKVEPSATASAHAWLCCGTPRHTLYVFDVSNHPFVAQ